MVFGFGLGPRRRIPEDPCVVARNEVRFWKTELDRCVEEKQQWIERCANAARQNEVLRTEVYLLQQDVGRLQEVLSLTPGSPQTQLLSPIRSVKGPHALSPLARMPQHHTPGSEEGTVEFTPAAKRYQSPCGADSMRQLQAAREEAARWRDEANSLRKYLQEARALNDSLRQQVGQQQHRAEFLRSTAEAYKNQAAQLQDKLLTQHGINDETADETVKLLQDLARLQQSNALLTRDLALKDGMIHLLQQQLSEQLSKPVTPRTGRSPERTTFSRSACSHSPDGHASPRNHSSSQAHFDYAGSAAGTSDGAPAFHSHSGTILADDGCTFHTIISEPSDDGQSVRSISAAPLGGQTEPEMQAHTQYQAHSESRPQAEPQAFLAPRPQPQPHLPSQSARQPQSQQQFQASLQQQQQHLQPRSNRPSGGGAMLPASVLGPLEGADLELAGLAAVHAAMYSFEKDSLKVDQNQLESAVAAARFEVAAHETSWDQVLDGLTSERVNSMAARWVPPKSKNKEAAGQGAAAPSADACQGSCGEGPCLCGQEGEAVTLERLREAAAASAAAGKAAAAGAGASPLRQQKARRPPKAKAR